MLQVLLLVHIVIYHIDCFVLSSLISCSFILLFSHSPRFSAPFKGYTSLNTMRNSVSLRQTTPGQGRQSRFSWIHCPMLDDRPSSFLAPPSHVRVAIVNDLPG